MSSDEYTKLADWLMQIEKRLEKVEGDSRQANSEQPLVGPPDKSEERPAALARPVTLSEVMSFVENKFRELYRSAGNTTMRVTMNYARNEILQGLGKLDQGPIASRFPKQFESQIGKCDPVDGYDP